MASFGDAAPPAPVAHARTLYCWSRRMDTSCSASSSRRSATVFWIHSPLPSSERSRSSLISASTSRSRTRNALSASLSAPRNCPTDDDFIASSFIIT
jgi:hypothetical protein